MLGVAKSQLIFAFGKVFRVWLPFGYCGILALFRSLLVGGVWNGFLLQRVRGELVPFHFCGILMEICTYIGNVLILLQLKCVRILNLRISREWIRVIGLGVSCGTVGYLHFRV